MVVGVLSLLSGVSGLLYNIPPTSTFPSGQVSIFTSILLIILGILTFLKPMNDIPVASVVGLLAGTAVVAVIIMSLPGEAYIIIGLLIDPTIFFAILFINSLTLFIGPVQSSYPAIS